MGRGHSASRERIKRAEAVGEEIAHRYQGADQKGYHSILYSLIQSLVSHGSTLGNHLEGLKLLQVRNKRAVLPIVGKALHVLFGTVSEADLGWIRRKLANVGGNQKILAQEAKRSLSILNVTRLEVAKDRRTINWLIRNIQAIDWELGNVTESLSAELRQLGGFLKQSIQLMMVIGKLRQASQSLLISLEHVRAQVDMLSLGHLSPSIVAPAHLRALLIKIQARLPYRLHCPQTPRTDCSITTIPRGVSPWWRMTGY